MLYNLACNKFDQTLSDLPGYNVLFVIVPLKL